MKSPYTRSVYYYETDQMGVVHHSNYIRWLEEARLAYMKARGVDLKEMEAAGVQMPVTDVTGSYLLPVRFGDQIMIDTMLTVFSGVRARFRYEIFSGGALVFQGESGHCFIDGEKKIPVSIKKRLPDLFEIGQTLLEGNDI